MGGQLSKETVTRREALPEKTQFARDVRIALYQHDQHTVRSLLCVANVEGFTTFLSSTDAAKLAKKYTSANRKEPVVAVEDLFTLRNVTKEMYLELVEKRWSGEFFAPFFITIRPTTEMTMAALSSCVLRNQYSGIDYILGRLAELHPATKGDINYQETPSVHSDKFPGIAKRSNRSASNSVNSGSQQTKQQREHRRVSAAFMSAQKLSYLFPIVCQQGDMDVIVRFIEYGLFDPSDPAPFRIVSHNAIRHYCSVLSRVGSKIWPTSANEDREEEESGGGTDVTTSAGAPGGAAAASPTTPSSTDAAVTAKDGYNDLTSDELQSVFVNPQSGQFKIDLSLPDTGAATAAAVVDQRESLSYLAVLVTIMSTHKFPGLDVVDAIIAAAIHRGRLRRRGGYATRQEMIDHAKAHHANNTASTLDEAERNYQFIPPVAAILSVYKGGYSPTTHSVHSPELRAKVQAAVEALHLCGFSEQVAVDVVGRLGEE